MIGLTVFFRTFLYWVHTFVSIFVGIVDGYFGIHDIEEEISPLGPKGSWELFFNTHLLSFSTTCFTAYSSIAPVEGWHGRSLSLYSDATDALVSIGLTKEAAAGIALSVFVLCLWRKIVYICRFVYHLVMRLCITVHVPSGRGPDDVIEKRVTFREFINLTHNHIAAETLSQTVPEGRNSVSPERSLCTPIDSEELGKVESREIPKKKVYVVNPCNSNEDPLYLIYGCPPLNGTSLGPYEAKTKVIMVNCDGDITSEKTLEDKNYQTDRVVTHSFVTETLHNKKCIFRTATCDCFKPVAQTVVQSSSPSELPIPNFLENIPLGPVESVSTRNVEERATKAPFGFIKAYGQRTVGFWRLDDKLVTNEHAGLHGTKVTLYACRGSKAVGVGIDVSFKDREITWARGQPDQYLVVLTPHEWDFLGVPKLRPRMSVLPVGSYVKVFTMDDDSNINVTRGASISVKTTAYHGYHDGNTREGDCGFPILDSDGRVVGTHSNGSATRKELRNAFVPVAFTVAMAANLDARRRFEVSPTSGKYKKWLEGDYSVNWEQRFEDEHYEDDEADRRAALEEGGQHDEGRFGVAWDSSRRSHVVIDYRDTDFATAVHSKAEKAFKQLGLPGQAARDKADEYVYQHHALDMDDVHEYAEERDNRGHYEARMNPPQKKAGDYNVELASLERRIAELKRLNETDLGLQESKQHVDKMLSLTDVLPVAGEKPVRVPRVLTLDEVNTKLLNYKANAEKQIANLKNQVNARNVEKYNKAEKLHARKDGEFDPWIKKDSKKKDPKTPPSSPAKKLAKPKSKPREIRMKFSEFEKLKEKIEEDRLGPKESNDIVIIEADPSGLTEEDLAECERTDENVVFRDGKRRLQ
jgi:hypothetical protein